MKTLVRVAREDEIRQWDKLLAKNPDGGDIFQSLAMAEVKKSVGWTPEFWVYETSFGEVYATVLVRKFPLVGKLAYIIRGPGVVTSGQLAEIVQANQSIGSDKSPGSRNKSGMTSQVRPCREKSSFFAIKMEPLLAQGMKVPPELVKVPNVQSIASTILVDLSPDESVILAGFRQRARREIREGEKDGLTVIDTDATDENCHTMFELYKTTVNRAGIKIRPKSYFVNFWKTFDANGQGRFFFVKDKNGQVIAGAFICWLGRKAIYKDGGSLRTAKHFSHLLQWEIMKWLKSAVSPATTWTAHRLAISLTTQITPMHRW